MPESYAPVQELLEGVAAITGRGAPPARAERLVLHLGGRSAAPENRSGAHSDQQLVNLWLDSKRSAHTRRAYEKDFAAFNAFLAALPATDEAQRPQRPWALSEVTVRHVQAFAAHLEASKASQRTIARRLSATKSLLTFAQQTGYLAYNVGSVIKLAPAASDLAQRSLSEDDVHRCIRSAPVGRDRTLVRFLYSSACRNSEAAALRFEHLAPRDDRLLVTIHGKGNKTRVVPIPRRFVDEFDALRRANMSGHVFESKGGRPLDSKAIWRIVTTAAEAAGLERRVSPHFLRHSHASHAIRRGAKIHVVQQTLGHSSVQTTGVYLHLELGESSAFYLEV